MPSSPWQVLLNPTMILRNMVGSHQAQGVAAGLGWAVSSWAASVRIASEM
jgi:hypothetical protein